MYTKIKNLEVDPLDYFDLYDVARSEKYADRQNLNVEIVSRLENKIYLPKNDSSKISIKFKFSDRSRDNSVYIDDILSFRGSVVVNGSGNNIFVSNSNQKITCNIDVRGQNNELVIGRDTSINQANLLVDGDGNSLTIGDECMLSYGIRIRTSDSHAIVDLKSRKQINYSQNVAIGPRVWIASNVMILKGVTIGEGSVVAASSVVTKAVPAISLVAGVPAKIIRKNVSWSRASLPKQVEIDRIVDHFESAGLLED
jgi:acetyltransferase-like isoleucine patch superfamily enzyme